jgi:hypothetical protein
MNEARKNVRGRGIPRRVAPVLTTLLVSILLLEIGSAVYWYAVLSRQSVPDLSSESSDSSDPHPSSGSTGRRQRFFDLHVEPKALHPYLGFSADIAADGVNSFGLPGVEPI